jgi:hypothetical protein
LNVQYWQLYAEQEAEEAAQLLGSNEPWDCSVVIPALAEWDLLRCLKSLESAAPRSEVRVLAVVLLNARKSHAPAVHETNLRVKEAIRDQYRYKAASKNLSLYHTDGNLSLLLVDRSITDFYFPEDQGVGLARKIGSDIAGRLYLDQKILSPLIRTTDADATVSEDYFSADPDGTLVGLGDHEGAGEVYPYRHLWTDSAHEEARSLGLYEAKLRYYQQGLEFARSPYAFPCIGSTLAFDARAYALVRGFPKRVAAEDSYFLTKLAQVGTIRRRTRGCVTLHFRTSDRVRIGTGASQKEITETLKQGKPYLVYAPNAFVWLKFFLESLDHLALEPDEDQWKSNLKEAGDALFDLLTRLKVFPAIHQALSSRKTPESRRRHFHTWFDGMKTLQFVLRGKEVGLSELELYEASELLTKITQSSPLAGGSVG